jgi:hypothetical protein
MLLWNAFVLLCTGKGILYNSRIIVILKQNCSIEHTVQGLGCVYGNVCLRHWLKFFEGDTMGIATALCNEAGRTASKVRKKHKQLRPSNVTEEQR